MVQRGEGRILLTSSGVSTMPGSYQAVCAASKSFVQSFALALREELKDTGVTVTSLMPWPTDTPFFERAGMQDTLVGASVKDDPADVARDGFEALMAGRERVVSASRTSRLQARAGRLLPDSAKAKMHTRMAKPGSAKHAQRARPIKATTHGLIDYGLAGLLAAAPVALRLDARARALSWGFAAIEGTVDALTDHGVAARRLIPLRVHRRIDMAAMPAFAVTALATGAVRERRALMAWLAVLTVLGATYAMTDYETPADA